MLQGIVEKQNHKGVEKWCCSSPWEEQHWGASYWIISSEANAFVSDIHLFFPDPPSKQELGLPKGPGFQHVAKRSVHKLTDTSVWRSSQELSYRNQQNYKIEGSARQIITACDHRSSLGLDEYWPESKNILASITIKFYPSLF